jgi:hypothetical protein
LVGSGGPAPQWIEVDLGALYSVSRIKVISQGPSGQATFRFLGRGTIDPLAWSPDGKTLAAAGTRL